MHKFISHHCFLDRSRDS